MIGIILGIFLKKCYIWQVLNKVSKFLAHEEYLDRYSLSQSFWIEWLTLALRNPYLLDYGYLK